MCEFNIIKMNLSNYLQKLIKKIYNKNVLLDKNLDLHQCQKYIDSLPKMDMIEAHIKPRGSDFYKAHDLLMPHLHEKDVVLDYGCGNGLVMSLIPNTSICIERKEMKPIHDKIYKPNPKSTFLYVNDDIEQLKDVLGLSKYTVISFFHVLHHVENLKVTLKKLIEYGCDLQKIVVLDHDCQMPHHHDILTLQHYFYRHVYNEVYYYTDFWSYKDMKKLFLELGFQETYHTLLPKHPDFSYLSVFELKKL